MKSRLTLEDGSVFEGRSFGFPQSVSGEVVFNTGMVGYPETLTDPSYKGQILVTTYPLIGNYGVSSDHPVDEIGSPFESDKLQISGLVVSEVSADHNHWNATRSLPQWLVEQGVPALWGIDTRSLTKRLREKGSMLGKILMDENDVELYDPNRDNLIAQVSLNRPVVYAGGKHRIVVIDGGCKNSIIRSLLAREVTVIRVPWDYDFLAEKFDAVLVSNGPGDPKACEKMVAQVRRAMERDHPIFGVCLGHQILALAAGGNTYKLKYGHRSQNQPCKEVGTNRCYITSRNHGYAVDTETLPAGWEPWFTNANDGTNEGLRRRTRPFMSVQFHPEAPTGPLDTNFLFDEFLSMI